MTTERTAMHVLRQRTALVAVVLSVTAVAAVPLGVLWPESSDGSQAYAYVDIAPIRQQWWLVLTLLAVMLPLNLTAQALATMSLVRSRGSSWATWGGAMMCVGAALQAVGITFLAGAYYFVTDAAVSRDSAAQVLAVITDDQNHLFATLIPGAILALLGTVAQVIGLFRAGTVPRWIPALLLFIVATFFVPGDGVAGLITSIPLAAGAVGLGYYVWRDGACPKASSRRVTQADSTSL